MKKIIRWQGDNGEVYNTRAEAAKGDLEEAIEKLGFYEQKYEIIQYWEELKLLFEHYEKECKAHEEN